MKKTIEVICFMQPSFSTVTYIGNKEFQVKANTGIIRQADFTICKVITYTYFQNDSYPLHINYPTVGWTITKERLINDYMSKVVKEIDSGKVPILKFWTNESIN